MKLSDYTFEYLMQSALANVDDSLDKRQGSIIYDALAPACYELAGYFIELQQMYSDTFMATAAGEYLDLRAAEQGLTRYPATYATKKAEFLNDMLLPITVPLGSRLSTTGDLDPINYVVTKQYEEAGIPVPGVYELECEVPGAIGNNYTGALINISFIADLVTATMSDLLFSASDLETDAELRERYFEAAAVKPFGGNIAQYRAELKSIDSVGDVQIYPVWDGGGTVKCSVVDNQYNRLTPVAIAELQDLIDPLVEGKGLGMAPIGHRVTITTPDEITIDIETNLTLMAGYILSQIETPINLAIEEYLQSLRAAWANYSDTNEYSLSIYVAKINAVILGVPGVANVTGTELNGVAADLVLSQTGATQEIPIKGAVVLNVT